MDNLEADLEVVNATRVTVRSENRQELCQTIWSLLAPMRSEKGCIAYHFYEEAGDENTFVLISEWETEADWHSHTQSDNFAVLIGSIMILGIRDNIEFKLLSHLGGIETVAKERMWSYG